MSSSFPYPCPPSSSVIHSSIPFALPTSLLFFSNRNKNHQAKLNSFPPLSTSIGNSSETIPSKNEVSELIIKEEDNPGLQVQDLAKKIKTLPITERAKIIQSVQKDVKFQSISDFNDLLMALFKSDEFKLALELFSNSSTFGLVPDCCTYSTIIRCYCKQNESIEAKQVLDSMIENGFQPKITTFTILIDSLCKRGRLKKAFEVFKITGDMGYDPSIQIYNCLLKGLCYVGKVEEAYEFLLKIKKASKRPDIYTYSAVMNGFCKVGRSNEALELLDEALKMGLKPNVVTFNSLLTGYFKEGRPLEGIVLLKKMRERYECVPDYISYSTLLHGLLKWGEIKEAFGVYNEMVEMGFEVDERMMNTLLRGLCRISRREKGVLKDVYEVFDKMSKWVLPIYHNTYGLVIEAFCSGYDAEKALVNLKKMVGFGYAPRNLTYNIVIQALCVEGKVDEALEVLVLMCEGQRIPSRISFNKLIDGLNQQERLLVARSVYGVALKLGLVPESEPKRIVN